MISLKEALIRKDRSVDINDVQKEEEILKFFMKNCKLYDSNGNSIYGTAMSKYININNGVVDVSVSVDLWRIAVGSITNGLFKFGTVDGNFNCGLNDNLISLEGAPEEIKGNFSCGGSMSLASLKGAPKKVGGNFNCGGCIKLTSLEGAPEEIEGNFECYSCKKLKSLKGAPKKVGGNFDCRGCKNLKSLKGAPEEVGGNFDCRNCSSSMTIDKVPICKQFYKDK